MSEVQSVMLRKSYFKNVKDAKNWIRQSEFTPMKPVDITKNWYRFIMTNPKKYKYFRIKKIHKYLHLVIGFK